MVEQDKVPFLRIFLAATNWQYVQLYCTFWAFFSMKKKWRKKIVLEYGAYNYEIQRHRRTFLGSLNYKVETEATPWIIGGGEAYLENPTNPSVFEGFEDL